MMKGTDIGYTGQRCSAVTGHYLLGNGYRGFNPVLKRFACQDSLSPFGGAGEHGYAYCYGNPTNSTDPSGHIPVLRQIRKFAGRVLRRLINSTIDSATEDATATSENPYIHDNILHLKGDVAGMGESSSDPVDDTILSEIDPSVRQPRAKDRAMFYLTHSGSDQLENYQLTSLKNGLQSKPSGLYQFVIRADEPHKVRVGKLTDPLGHTSLTYKTSKEVVGVRYAGEIHFAEDGHLIKWTNKSGHFQPTANDAGNIVDLKDILPTTRGIRRLQYF